MDSETLDFIQDEETTKDLFLSFDLDNQDYAIGVPSIKEIITMSDITKVPQTAHYVKGIINLRGDIVPVIDVRLRFSKPEKQYDEQTCIVVLEFEEYIIGLIVDKVNGVFTITETNITKPPSVNLSYGDEFVKSIGRIGDKTLQLLDVGRLLFD